MIRMRGIMFLHREGLELKDLKTKSVDGKRHYDTPGGLYPSVTTITSQVGKQAIKEWRARVGPEEANKIVKKASRRGTRVHKICEDYINNVELDYKKIEPINHFLFKQIKPILDIRFEEVLGVECALYSDYLRVAGRVDCVGIFDGKASIIDFKTASKRKRKDWIQNYFMQESAYAVMFEERYKIPVSQLVTIIAIDSDEPQLFIENRNDHIQEFIRYRDLWESNQK